MQNLNLFLYTHVREPSLARASLLDLFPHYNPAQETTFKDCPDRHSPQEKLSLSLLSLIVCAQLKRPFWSSSVALLKIQSDIITMPEARDRIQRPVDYSAILVNRRSHGVLLDEPDSRLNLIEFPVQRLPSDSQVGTGGIVRGNFSTWRPANGRGHSPFRFAQGRENMPLVSTRRERDRASPSVLPSWYPRTPLRHITHIIRAIERRRGAGMGVGDGRDIEIPTHQQVGVLESPVPLSGEHKCSMVTPGPSVGFKRSCPPSTAKVHKMLLDITKEIAEEDAGFVTPEKKLLNSIDKVEKIVMAEIQKLKSTPHAKREEREKRVRTLMSMR